MAGGKMREDGGRSRDSYVVVIGRCLGFRERGRGGKKPGYLCRIAEGCEGFRRKIPMLGRWLCSVGTGRIGRRGWIN